MDMPREIIMWRCDTCGGMYQGEPVTECDCTVGEKTVFREWKAYPADLVEKVDDEAVREAIRIMQVFLESDIARGLPKYFCAAFETLIRAATSKCDCDGLVEALEKIAKRPDLPNPERDADWKNCMKWSAYEAQQALAAHKQKGKE